MNQRSYESALKDLLEDIATSLEFYEPGRLAKLKMPNNVNGVPEITVVEWLDARYQKRKKAR